MERDAGRDARFERGDEARFSGEVWIRSGPTAPDGTNVGVVHFSPGARTHRHMHPGGQFLYGERPGPRADEGQAGALLSRAMSRTCRRGSGISTAASRTVPWFTSRVNEAPTGASP